MNGKTTRTGTKGMDVLFETRDLKLASYLKMKGYELRKTIKEKGGKVLFCFLDRQEDGEREKDVLDFYNNVGGYQSYIDAWTNLKSLLFEMHRNLGDQ